ncbi:MAG: N-acetylmuramoyl-L-alanine amidase, partial [Prevotella sp.]|nr:N-acetylmuramoyl-L-alanine amidase [Prevotella sp.]
MRKILGLAFCLFLFWGISNASDSKFVVVIDAGHGGKDGGAVRGIYKEKVINLGVALALGQLIERNHKDVKVIYTRKTDTFIALDRRAEIANKAKANLFISIHTNSTGAKTTNASGADTYILGLARSEENLEVAKRENS